MCAIFCQWKKNSILENLAEIYQRSQYLLEKGQLNSSNTLILEPKALLRRVAEIYVGQTSFA